MAPLSVSTSRSVFPIQPGHRGGRRSHRCHQVLHQLLIGEKRGLGQTSFPGSRSTAHRRGRLPGGHHGPRRPDLRPVERSSFRQTEPEVLVLERTDLLGRIPYVGLVSHGPHGASSPSTGPRTVVRTAQDGAREGPAPRGPDVSQPASRHSGPALQRLCQAHLSVTGVDVLRTRTLDERACSTDQK